MVESEYVYIVQYSNIVQQYCTDHLAATKRAFWENKENSTHKSRERSKN